MTAKRKNELRTYGFKVREDLFADQKSIVVTILARRPGEHHPINGDGDGERKGYGQAPARVDGLNFYDLEIRWWVCNGGVTGPHVWYRGSDINDLKRCKTQLRTLERIEKILAGVERPLTVVGALEAIAERLGITFTPVPAGAYSFYSDTSWRFEPARLAIMQAHNIVESWGAQRRAA